MKMKLISDKVNLNFYYSCICDQLKDHSNLSTKATDLKQLRTNIKIYYTAVDVKHVKSRLVTRIASGGKTWDFFIS